MAGVVRRAFRKARAWVELTRPFTLLAPALGMITVGIAATGAVEHGALAVTSGPSGQRVLLGALAAAILNAASNALNQVTDLAADRINKPARPVPSGRISVPGALVFSVLGYAMALGIAALLGRATFAVVAGGALCTVVYSAPPFRFKRFGWLANLTIATSRGLLLTAAGWSTVASLRAIDPWWLGSVLALFLSGAASTKDFGDVDGDRAAGFRTLAVRYGIDDTIRRIRPAFVWPFLLLPLGSISGLLLGNRATLCLLGFTLAVWGWEVTNGMVRAPHAIDAASGNHASWKQMYLLMLVFQLGIALAYRA